jgi:hypothetical protein
MAYPFFRAPPDPLTVCVKCDVRVAFLAHLPGIIAFTWRNRLARHVHFGSKADIATDQVNVRFTPKADV